MFAPVGSTVVDASRSARYRESLARIKSLFDEVAEVAWEDPVWSSFAGLLAASEVLSRRSFSSELASRAFTLALRANGELAADTFMAVAGSACPVDARARVARAISRAEAAARALRDLDRSAPDQALCATLRSRRGWLEPERLPHARRVAFIVRDASYLVMLSGSPHDERLAGSLLAALEGRPHDLERIDPSSREPTPVAAAIAVEPVTLTWARSFHRLAWTRGGGPWMGVADCPPHSVVSTCHAAVDGYIHARVTSELLSGTWAHGSVAITGRPPPSALVPPEVGFATCAVPRDPPRFAVALHAFATVLDRRIGTGTRTSVAIHVPIAPGDRTDPERWRRRPLYGLLALRKHDGRLESAESLAQRLPAFLARESAGGGLLTRVLRAACELPAPLPVRRLLIERQPAADRVFAPARALTGAGYFSWMRFPRGEGPRAPIYPSALPSFSAHRGGAGLSITQTERGALAAGLTTSGSLGTAAIAEDFLAEWTTEIARARREPERRTSPRRAHAIE